MKLLFKAYFVLIIFLSQTLISYGQECVKEFFSFSSIDSTLTVNIIYGTFYYTDSIIIKIMVAHRS